MKKKKDDQKTRNIIITIIIIIIIILLLLHSCLNNKNGKNGIDICTGDDCNQKSGLLIDCMEDVDNPLCVVPDFRGKTEDDINEWLSKIANNIDINYLVYDSDQQDGLVIDQSTKEKITVKDLLENKIQLAISFANSRTYKIDCLEDVDNEKCVVPALVGKTKKDLYDWLNKISNDIDVNIDEKKSNKKAGTITNQSVKSGTTVKDLIDNNVGLDVSFAQVEKVNCLEDVNNSVCIVPNLTGYTTKEIDEWLDSISNSIVINYVSAYSDAKEKTVLDQSIKPGTSIKDFLDDGTPFIITLATNETSDKVNCIQDPNNQKCILPNFSGMTKDDVDTWLNGISNNIPISYETLNSNSSKGTIVNQSIGSGTTVKDILDNNQLLLISISSGNSESNQNQNNNAGTNNNNNASDDVEPVPEPEPDPIPEEDDGKVVVKDSSVTWETDTEIDIFNNSVVNEFIAPESSNTYRFTVYNNTETDIKYNLSFVETNNYNINMKFKLRKNNSYVVSEYSSISELNLSNQLLNANKNDVFYLEWKWISTENDTEIGNNPNAQYSLKIEVKAESISE